jgi:uncharacterized repeat protein (TIGR02543 family)
MADPGSSGNATGSVTDANGSYFLPGLSVANYNVTVDPTCGGTVTSAYGSQSSQEQVTSQDIATYNVTLASAAPATDTITFNAENGTANVTSNVPVGVTWFPTLTPTFSGYTFNGWFTAPTGGTQVASLIVPTGPITLYAQWTQNVTTPPVTTTTTPPVTTTTTDFNSDGGSDVTAMSGTDGTTITLPSAPTRTGYTFDGWFTSATGGTQVMSPYTLAGTTTLYAQWTAKAVPVVTDTITFYSCCNGKDTEGHNLQMLVTTMSGADGSSITLPSAPTRTGYTFLGWYAEVTIGESALTSPYTLAGTTSLFAEWTANAVAHALRVVGVTHVGKSSLVRIVGSTFVGRPALVSNARFTRVQLVREGKNYLLVRVIAGATSPRGVHTFTIRLANGKSCRVNYLVK